MRLVADGRMAALTDCFPLANGVGLPCIGLGTGHMPDDDVAAATVRAGLAAGYRHIDTAASYANEKGVGRGLADSGVPRREVFVTSKLANTVRGYDETIAAFEKTLADLGLDYLDLYLVHWPNPVYFRPHGSRATAESWRAMETLHAAGRIRAIGVSNFLPHHLDALAETATVTPMVNQIRLCPGGAQDEVVAHGRARGILPEAYSPLGTGAMFAVPELRRLAEKYGRSVAQLCVRWCLQHGYAPLPKSVTPERIRENADVFSFELAEEDMRLMDGLTGTCDPPADPDTGDF